jgi:hypothetical protein
VKGTDVDALLGDIELPDEEELAQLETLADLRQIDAIPQLELERDDE